MKVAKKLEKNHATKIIWKYSVTLCEIQILWFKKNSVKCSRGGNKLIKFPTKGSNQDNCPFHNIPKWDLFVTHSMGLMINKYHNMCTQTHKYIHTYVHIHIHNTCTHKHNTFKYKHCVVHTIYSKNRYMYIMHQNYSPVCNQTHAKCAYTYTHTHTHT